MHNFQKSKNLVDKSKIFSFFSYIFYRKYNAEYLTQKFNEKKKNRKKLYNIKS